MLQGHFSLSLLSFAQQFLLVNPSIFLGCNKINIPKARKNNTKGKTTKNQDTFVYPALQIALRTKTQKIL